MLVFLVSAPVNPCCWSANGCKVYVVTCLLQLSIKAFSCLGQEQRVWVSLRSARLSPAAPLRRRRRSRRTAISPFEAPSQAHTADGMGRGPLRRRAAGRVRHETTQHSSSQTDRQPTRRRPFGLVRMAEGDDQQLQQRHCTRMTTTMRMHSKERDRGGCWMDDAAGRPDESERSERMDRCPSATRPMLTAQLIPPTHLLCC